MGKLIRYFVEFILITIVVAAFAQAILEISTEWYVLLIVGFLLTKPFDYLIKILRDALKNLGF